MKELLERRGRVRVETGKGGLGSKVGGFGDLSKPDNFCIKTVC